MTHEPPAADVTIDEIAARLGAQFPVHPASTIHDLVSEAYDELKDAKVRDFVEVLDEKQAKKRLKALQE